MASRSPEALSPFACIDRFRFDEDGGCVDDRLRDTLGAREHFFTCRERFDRPRGVLPIVDVEKKDSLQIAPRDEGCSRTWLIDVPASRTETIAVKPAMLLPLAVGLQVFGRFYLRQTPSVGQRLSLDTTKREASHNRHRPHLKACSIDRRNAETRELSKGFTGGREEREAEGRLAALRAVRRRTTHSRKRPPPSGAACVRGLFCAETPPAAAPRRPGSGRL